MSARHSGHHQPTGFGIGQPVRRKEDLRFVTGRGEYSDDLSLPGEAHMAILRSPHAHARIRSIDASAALKAPGVIAVLTGADFIADGLKPLPNRPVPPDLPFANFGGRDTVVPPDFPVAIDMVRHAGEAVALVIAETRLAAHDARELIEVDYESLPAVSTVEQAVADGAPRIWDAAPQNLCVNADRGDKAATEAAFAGAAHVTRLELYNNRVNGIPLEPGAVLGECDPATGDLTMHGFGQGVIIQRNALCGIFGKTEDQVRVICRDVGGGYGTRNLLFREHALTLWAAQRLKRPVKWRADRSESFLSDPYGRDLTTTAELGLDKDGRFLAVRLFNIANIGSQALHLVPLARGAAVPNGVYDIPAVYVRLQAVFTNTVPTTTYRGAGRPEAMFIIERLIDAAAREMGIDRFELRRRNFIRPEQIPYLSPVGTRYDSGEFQANMDRTLDMADADGFAARRAASERRGKLRGFGLGNYVETATGIPFERAVVDVKPDGVVELILGTQASGQGHETAFAQLVHSFLGVPYDSVVFRHGDTSFVKMGSGSHSSRSMRLAGLLVGRATKEILDRARTLAARALQATEAELDFADGVFSVRGSERRIDLFAVAALAGELEGGKGGLSATSETSSMLPTFPNGCHACEVEIDPETGAIDIVSWAAVDDVGRVINPLLVDGQTHGAIAQGVGQALLEECVHDPDSAQLLSGSFMDYAMPRADLFPEFVIENNEVPAPNNPLGVKGAGEGGTTGAPPALINAIVDALAPYGVTNIRMPATAQRVWQAIQAGKKN